LVLTPSNNIRSQINIPDDKGHASLFEAEMYRCKHNLDLIKEHPDHRMLLVMDEIFNSTNPVEGISGAFAIAHRLAVHPNTLVFFTTHYTYLSKLEKQSQFRNYRMNVIKNNDIIQYPYKLERGISKQNIALELLKLNGFDSDIIDHALILKEKFVPTRV
jgi:DNA mismatch repair protein MSH6